MSTLALHGGAPVCTKPWPQWPQWGESERQQLERVLESGEWGGYNETVGQFEAAFARRHDARHCIAATNGTLSLVAALQANHIGPGDEVIVPPYTFIATANAVQLVGATPVFVDIELETFNIDLAAVAAAVTERTRAVIPVHFAGLPVDMDALMALAEKHDLLVVEDAAHAHGSTWNGRPVGALGHIGSFSFQASKNLTAGEGGALLTNHDDLRDRLWSYVNQGRAPQETAWYGHPNLGSNLRLSGWQAGILLAQLGRFEEQLARRMENARRLHDILAEVDGLQPTRWDERVDHHAHHLFIMRYDPAGFNGVARETFVAALQAEGVPCSTGYDRPLYQHPPLSGEHSRITGCPQAEQACREAIWLSQSTLLAKPGEMDEIAAAIFKIRDQIDALAEA
jgi:dTDP-4-amino-4,6-dideoxygalactose transaminase